MPFAICRWLLAPNTPEASHTASTPPASSVSPQTPPDVHGPVLAKVALTESSPVEAPDISHGHAPIPTPAKPSRRICPLGRVKWWRRQRTSALRARQRVFLGQLDHMLG